MLHLLLKSRVPVTVVLSRVLYKEVPDKLKEAFEDCHTPEYGYSMGSIFINYPKYTMQIILICYKLCTFAWVNTITWKNE